jgi:DNA-binding transcriptional regulator YhcF (GntR family)
VPLRIRAFTTSVNKNQFFRESSEQLLSRRALADRWGVCRETIKRAERAGLIRAIRFNERLLRYKLSDIVAIEEAAK